MSRKVPEMQLSPFPMVVKTCVVDLEEGMCGETSYCKELRACFVKWPEEAPDDILGTAIHEACHVRQFLEKMLDEQLSDETQAYLEERIATWLFRQALKFYEEAERQTGIAGSKLTSSRPGYARPRMRTTGLSCSTACRASS